MTQTVLVTGATGFVAGWSIAELLRRGYTVRATVRGQSNDARVRAAVARAVEPGDRLSLVKADLLDDDGWDAAVAGCDYVLHVASPLIATKDEPAVIRPAVDGVVRVLRAARDGGVQRVVFTSTCGSIYYGHPPQAEPFDESSWTNVQAGGMSAYVKSKALAERAAWDFIKAEGGALELTTVNPSGIFGPALSLDVSSSLTLIKRLLIGGLPACPDLWFGVVDVRDVVDLHLRAMTAPSAGGERFIATSGPAVSMLDIAATLRERLGDEAKNVPTRKLPDWVVRVIGRFNTNIGDLVPLLGQRRDATSAKAQRELGWTPRSWQDAVTATAESLLQLGVASR